MNRWGIEGPPEEAYSRLTNPERFRPLHAAAYNLITQLFRQFDVAMRDGMRDVDLERVPLAGPTLGLIPNDPAAAPMTVAFTAFPGLRVRFGRWLVEPFPACGCDACDETVEGQIERFSWTVTQLVDGRFRESIRAGFGRRFYRTHELWALNGDASGGETLIHEVTSEIRSAKGVVDWAPWPRKVAELE